MNRHPHRAGRTMSDGWGWITFLVTGPEAQLMAWQYAAMFAVEFFDRRGQTVRCRAHGDGESPGLGAYRKAVELARQHDVTVQDLTDTGRRENARAVGGLPAGVTATVSDCVEEYPVVHLGSHGMTWPPPKKRKAKRPCPPSA